MSPVQYQSPFFLSHDDKVSSHTVEEEKESPTLWHFQTLPDVDSGVLKNDHEDQRQELQMHNFTPLYCFIIFFLLFDKAIYVLFKKNVHKEQSCFSYNVLENHPQLTSCGGLLNRADNIMFLETITYLHMITFVHFFRVRDFLWTLLRCYVTVLLRSSAG